MNEFIFFLNTVVISGTVIGSIYAMGAIGVTLIFGILRFAHFAHADMMTLGAFLTLILATLFPAIGPALGLPTAFVLMPVAMVATAFIAIGIDKVFYRPLREHGVKPVVMVMASVGVTLMLQGLIRFFAGTGTQSLFVGERKDIFRIDLPFESASRALVVTEPQVILFIFLIAAVTGLHYFLNHTRPGKAMRAMSDNPELASMSGINTNTIVGITWVIAGGLACAAGTLLSLDVALKPNLSFMILLPIFAAAIVGGVGHPYGALAGGFLVGFSETLAVFNWSFLLRPLEKSLGWLDLPNNLAFVPTEYKITIPFFILVAVLVWRPTGLFKGKIL